MAVTEVISSRDPIEAIMGKVRQTRPNMVVKAARHDSTLTRALFDSADWNLISNRLYPRMLVKGHEIWDTRRITACVDPGISTVMRKHVGRYHY